MTVEPRQKKKKKNIHYFSVSFFSVFSAFDCELELAENSLGILFHTAAPEHIFGFDWKLGFVKSVVASTVRDRFESSMKPFRYAPSHRVPERPAEVRLISSRASASAALVLFTYPGPPRTPPVIATADNPITLLRGRCVHFVFVISVCVRTPPASVFTEVSYTTNKTPDKRAGKNPQLTSTRIEGTRKTVGKRAKGWLS